MTHYVAKFSNGEIVERKTRDRTYTHAYLAIGTYNDRNGEERPFKYGGFSSSAHQARKNMESELSWMRRGGREVTFSEVVEIEDAESKAGDSPSDNPDPAQETEK